MGYSVSFFSILFGRQGYSFGVELKMTMHGRGNILWYYNKDKNLGELDFKIFETFYTLVDNLKVNIECL